MSEIDDTRIDSLPPEDNRNLLKDKVIECSWTLNVLHYRSIGKWDTIITFHDQDNKKFKFSFSIGSINELQILIDRLKNCQGAIGQIMRNN